MSTISFLTLGCKLNYAETSSYERGFKACGLEVVKWNEGADVYLINTCSVTATSDSKSRNLIRKVHRINPKALIMVTGCSAELRKDEISKIEGVTRVFGAKEKSIVVQATLALLGYECQMAPESDSSIFKAYSSGERTRSFLKVQDGCNNFCAYCTVPYARGESRNIPICECVKQASEIARAGIKEIVLTGVNTGDFGRSSGESFLDLLKALNEVEGIERYRISSIEPNLLTDDIIDWISSGKTKFQKHFHIPLQSGSDLLLSRMGRHYDTAFFEQLIAKIRSRLEKDAESKVFFGIDVIVGLPGESLEEFERTKLFLEKIRPAFIHIFPYSIRSGTPAASMSGQVSEVEKRRRVAILEELCLKLHNDFYQEHKGIKEKVLFESTNRKGSMEGYTGNYIRVTRPYDKALCGQIKEVIL